MRARARAQSRVVRACLFDLLLLRSLSSPPIFNIIHAYVYACTNRMSATYGMKHQKLESMLLHNFHCTNKVHLPLDTIGGVLDSYLLLLLLRCAVWVWVCMCVCDCDCDCVPVFLCFFSSVTSDVLPLCWVLIRYTYTLVFIHRARAESEENVYSHFLRVTFKVLWSYSLSLVVLLM